MLAQIEAVVAGEHDDGVLGQLQLVKFFEQTPDVLVHRRQAAEIAAEHAPATSFWLVPLLRVLLLGLSVGLPFAGGEFAEVGGRTIHIGRRPGLFAFVLVRESRRWLKRAVSGLVADD